MPLASEGSKIMAAILDWWYAPENERLEPKTNHPIEKENHENHLPPPFWVPAVNFQTTLETAAVPRPPPPANVASPATSGADMEQIWRSTAAGKSSPNARCREQLPTFLH